MKLHLTVFCWSNSQRKCSMWLTNNINIIHHISQYHVRMLVVSRCTGITNFFPRYNFLLIDHFWPTRPVFQFRSLWYFNTQKPYINSLMGFSPHLETCVDFTNCTWLAACIVLCWNSAGRLLTQKFLQILNLLVSELPLNILISSALITILIWWVSE